MATQKKLSSTPSPVLYPLFRSQTTGVTRTCQGEKFHPEGKHIFSWEQLTSAHPLVYLVQPDYYQVFRFSSPDFPVYQENVHSAPEQTGIEFDQILTSIEPEDLRHLHRIDKVLCQFSLDCRLRPFDYICSIMVRWNSCIGDQRYMIRKTTILKSDDSGIPTHLIVTYKDVSSLVSSIKSNNVDITFNPDRADLCIELSRRIKNVQPKLAGITNREKEILLCLFKGMSSKEIGSSLFISKATVDTHRQNLIHKWEVTNTAALLKKAMEVGCI